MPESERDALDKDRTRGIFEHALKVAQPEFGNFFLARLLNMDISYGEDFCKVIFEVEEFMLNPQGTLHGGITALVLDVSMGHLLNHTSGPGATLEMKTQYLKPVASGPLITTGRFLKRGRALSFLASEMLDSTGDSVAFATATWKSLKS